MSLKLKSVTSYEYEFSENKEIITYGPVNQKISFAIDPSTKNNISQESLSKERFGLYADSLESSSIRSSGKAARISKKNHYKMDTMRWYGDIFVSNNSLIDAGMAFALKEELKFSTEVQPLIGEPEFNDPIYVEFLKIYYRTNRYIFTTKDKWRPSSIGLLDFSYHPTELISNLLWLLAKGPHTVGNYIKLGKFNTKRVEIKKFSSLNLILDPENYSKSKIAKEKISEILDEYLPLNERRHPTNPECIKWINKLGLEKSSYYLHEFHNENDEWYGKFAENTNLYLALSAIGENVIEQCQLDFKKCIKNMHENYLLAGKSEYIKDIDEFEIFLHKKDNNYQHNLRELIKHRLKISSLIGFQDMKENLYFNYY
tara:strand:+ start:1062 stop:2174 length:1113 start_codon:yes stop_codon:yes gene_type:complete